MSRFVCLVIFLTGCQSLPAISSLIKGPPRAERTELKHVARVGEEVRLKCPIEGHPAPMVTWSKAGENIDYGWTRFRANRRNLKIKDVNKDDTGVYKCKGINGFGKAEIKIQLIIIDPDDFPNLKAGQLPSVSAPEFTQATKDSKKEFYLRPGQDFRISCSALGDPAPKLTWYRNSERWRDSSITTIGGKTSLVIRNIDTRDEATFSCVADNLAGSTTASFILSVEPENDQLGGIQPDIITGINNITREEGDRATFDCKVRSSARPNIKWLKKLEPNQSGNQSHVIPVGDDKYRLIHNSRDVPVLADSEYMSQLVIKQVEEKDAGMYICFVTSAGGGFNYRPAYLTVIRNSSLAGDDSFPVLVLVICLAVFVVLLLLGITVCVVQAKHKHHHSPPQPDKDVQKSLMQGLGENRMISTESNKLDSHGSQIYSGGPIPPPPTPQWTHSTLKQSRSGYGPCDGRDIYEHNQYEVPHVLQHGVGGRGGSVQYGFYGHREEAQVYPVYGQEEAQVYPGYGHSRQNGMAV